MNAEKRHLTEQQIARAATTGIVDAGFRVSVNDGEATVLVRSDNVKAILAAMFSTDSDTLHAYAPPEEPGGQWKRIGFVEFIYGNDGWDVIADNSLTLEGCLKDATALSARLERESS